MNSTEEPIVKNLHSCRICGAGMDRYPHRFECTGCGAVADPVTGISNPKIMRN